MLAAGETPVATLSVPPKSPLTDAVLALGASRTRALATIARHYNQRSTDQAILTELSRAGRRTNTELTRALGMTSGGMTPALKRLEGRGLVERTPDPDDRRSSRLELTGQGRRMMGLGRSIVHEALADLEEALDEEQARAVLAVLEAAMRGYDVAAERLTSPEGEIKEWVP